MALSIGTLVGYLQLDDTNFNRKADAADRKVNALKLHLEALKRTNPKISVEVDAQTAKLDELNVKIADLKAKAAQGADVRVEMTQALVEIDRVQSKLREMHNSTIKLDVDDRAANAKLDALAAKIRGNGGPGWLMTSAAALGPTILPVLTAASGALAGLGSGAVSAAGGIGVLKLAYHGLGAEVSAYTKYQQALAVATTAAQRKAAAHTLATSAYGTATGPSQQFAQLVASQGLPAVHQLQSTAQRAVFPGSTQALRDLITLLPTADRLVSRLGSTMGTMEAKAAHALTNPFWRHFFDDLGKRAETDLPIIGRTFGYTFEGIARAIDRFAPQGTSLLTWVEHLAQRFDQWTAGGKGSSFEHFMSSVSSDGHAVVGVLRQLVPLATNLGSGLNSVGVTELKGLGWGLAQLAKVPPGPLKAIGEALPAIVLGLKGVALARGGVAALVGLSGTLGKIKGLGGLSKLGGVAGEAGSVALGGKGVVPVYVTNEGFGGPGKGGGGKSPIGTLGTWGAILGGGAFLAHLGFAQQHSDDQKLAQQGLSTRNVSQWGDILKAQLARKQAIQDTKDQTKAQEALNQVLLSPALPDYGKKLKALPRAVQTAIATPGAVQSLSDVKKLADQYHLTPKQVQTVVAVTGADNALTAVQRLQRQLAGLHNKIVNVTVAVNNGAHFSANLANFAAFHARGGIITGPGTGTSDSIPAMLSNGEFVVNAAAAARNRPLLEAINAQRYAAGGSVHHRHHADPRRRHLQAELAHLQNLISQAESFASAFAPNVFSAGLPTTKDVTVPGGVQTQIINGQVVTTHAAGTTKTVNLTNKQILAEMMKYAHQQDHQARVLARNVKKLRHEGLSKSLIAQMQAAGPSGIAEINALASGTRAQVQEFNRLNAQTSHRLGNAGAYAAAGERMAQLKGRKADEQAIYNGMTRALKHTPIHVAHGPNLRHP